jgi:hypothetical protein
VVVRIGPHSACVSSQARLPLDGRGKLFRLCNDMQSPLVVDALREQLLRVLDWYQKSPPGFRWGTVIHRRNERGKLRFGAVTPQGESLVLSEALLVELGSTACWLDGAVRVRLECRIMGESQPWIDAFARPSRPRMVEALAVYFDPDTSPEETMAFQAMAGVLTPAQCPSELFLLTRKRPAGWPA